MTAAERVSSKGLLNNVNYHTCPRLDLATIARMFAADRSELKQLLQRL